MGTQLVGNQKKALFSIWDITENANTAIPTGNCQRFSGEGTGAQCLIDYDWVEGREYRLRLWALTSVPGGEQWVAAIYDTLTLAETTIGVIELKDSGGYAGYGWLNNNVTSAGRPFVTHEAGGTVQQITPPSTELWQNTSGRVIVNWAYPTDASDANDGRGNPKSIFKPGESIAYNFESYNDNGIQVTPSYTGTTIGPCGSIWLREGNLPLTRTNDLTLFNSIASIPFSSCAGTYTYTVSITYNNFTSLRSVTFAVTDLYRVYLPVLLR